MSISPTRIKVGQPYNSTQGRASRAVKWGSSAPPKKETTPRLRLVRVKTAKHSMAYNVSPYASIENISMEHLSFLSIKHFVAMAAAALVIVLLILTMVRVNHEAVAYSYDISSLTQNKLEVLEQNRQLKMELAKLTALDKLEDAAKNTLGLVVPRHGQIVVIE